MIRLEFKKDLIIYIIGIFLFFTIAFLVKDIKFMQNDDWVYYKTVEKFIIGDYHLAEKIGVTFYTQGFLGSVFAYIFGIKNLPFLTLIISVGNFLLISLTLFKKFKIELSTSVLIGLLLFFIPIHFYSVLGFMTENFVLFFILLGIYFVNTFLEKKAALFFICANIAFLAAFFVKQYAIVGFIAFVVILYTKRLYKYFYLGLIFTVSLNIYYWLYFPSTEIIENQSIRIMNLVDLNYIYSLVFVAGNYAVAMLIPLAYIYVFLNLKLKSKGDQILIVFGSVFFMFIFRLFFLKTGYPMDLFPYIGNSFDKKGFFPGDLTGNKYAWRGVFDVFKFWDYLSLFGVSALFITLISKFNKRIFKDLSFELILFILYFGLCLVSWNLYDRYLLPLIFIGSLILVKNIKNSFPKYSNYFIFLFVLFLAALDFQFGKDFVNWESYVWNKSLDLASDEKISKSTISATRAWNKYYGNFNKLKYQFTFDSPGLVDNPNYELIEVKDFSSSMNIFLNPKVYLYKVINE